MPSRCRARFRPRHASLSTSISLSRVRHSNSPRRRFLGDFLASQPRAFGLLEPNPAVSSSVYGTEGQRFESSRARLVAGFSPDLSVGAAPKVNRSMPRYIGPRRRPPIFWRLFWRRAGRGSERLRPANGSGSGHRSGPSRAPEGQAVASTSPRCPPTRADEAANGDSRQVGSFEKALRAFRSAEGSNPSA
jgi:hypothetical protein